MPYTDLEKKIKAVTKEIIDTGLFVIIMVILIRFFIGEIRWIPSGSMHPTLMEGDRIFVEKVTLFFKKPQRGDILVFYPPMEPLQHGPMAILGRLTGFFCKDVAYIKRVVGMPGDKLFVKPDADGRYFVYINGKKYYEPYVLNDYDYTPCMKDMYCGPFTIPQGKYFMMGDNRGNSQDSRFWGFLSDDRVIGKAVFLFWPLNRVHPLTIKKNKS